VSQPRRPATSAHALMPTTKEDRGASSTSLRMAGIPLARSRNPRPRFCPPTAKESLPSGSRTHRAPGAPFGWPGGVRHRASPGRLLTPTQGHQGMSPRGGRREAENRAGSRLRRLRGRLRRPVGLCRGRQEAGRPLTSPVRGAQNTQIGTGQCLGPRCATATQIRRQWVPWQDMNQSTQRNEMCRGRRVVSGRVRGSPANSDQRPGSGARQ
jgi:hypothetical protein